MRFIGYCVFGDGLVVVYNFNLNRKFGFVIYIMGLLSFVFYYNFLICSWEVIYFMIYRILINELVNK